MARWAAVANRQFLTFKLRCAKLERTGSLLDDGSELLNICISIKFESKTQSYCPMTKRQKIRHCSNNAFFYEKEHF